MDLDYHYIDHNSIDFVNLNIHIDYMNHTEAFEKTIGTVAVLALILFALITAFYIYRTFKHPYPTPIPIAITSVNGLTPLNPVPSLAPLTPTHSHGSIRPGSSMGSLGAYGEEY